MISTLVVASTLVSGRSDRAIAASPDEQKLPFDVSQVPSDAQLVVAVRPSQLLAHKRIEPLVTLVSEVMEFEKNFGAAIETVDQFVIAGNNVTTARTLRMIVRLRSPIDQDKFRIRADAKSEDVGGTKLFSAPADQVNTLAYYFANERTVVIGEPDELRTWLNTRRDQIWNAAGWQDVAQKDAAVWLDVKAMRPGLSPPTQHLNMLTPFAVLWEQTDTVVVGGRLDEKLTLDVTATCTNPENAGRVQKTIEAAVTLSLNSLDAIKAEAGASDQLASLLTSAAEELLNQVKLSRSGATVELKVEAPLESLPLAATLVPSMKAAREAARGAQSSNNMKQLAIVLHSYADAHGHFPPAVVLGRDGKTPHSWRVEVLPYLDQAALYNQYKMDEPWDSENNKKVLLQMPAVFRSPNDNEKSFHASYVAVTGPETIFCDDRGTKFQQITDGTSNTIMLVEVKGHIPWTKPEDIVINADKELPMLGGWAEENFLATFADGSVQPIPKNVDEAALRALFTKAGGEPVNRP
jgi:hypothetical protein